MFVFRKGAAILATAFDEARSLLLVTLTSSDPLARGSTADVYQGETPEHVFRGKLVALKVYTTTLVPDEAREQLCRREIRVGRRARHPFILPFLGLATQDCYTILVTPFMRNGDVLQYLQRYPLANRNRLVIQVAKAINYLHNKIGVVHGDLKCENILVSDDDMIQLSDFGLCTRARKGEERSVGHSHSKAPSSQTGASGSSVAVSRAASSNRSVPFSKTFTLNRNKYTLGFAAPELLLDDDCELLPARTTESDIYAFGAVMLQIFTGEPPGGRTSFHDCVMNAHSGTKPPRRSARDISRGLISSWWKLCLDCLRCRPSDRPVIGGLLIELKSSYKMANLLSFLRWSAYRPHEFTKWREMLFSSSIFFSYEDYKEDLLTAASYLWQESIAIEQVGRNQQLTEILDVLADALSWGSTLQTSSVMRPLGEILGTPSARGHGAWPFPLAAPSYLTSSSITFLTEGLVVSGPWQDPLRMSWDAFSGERVALPANLSGTFTCVAVSASGRHGAVGSSDGSAHIWALGDDGLIKPVLTVEVSYDAGVQKMCLSPDGLCLATSSDGVIRMWDAVRGTPTGRVAGHPAGDVVCLACTSAGVRIATVTKSRRHALRLWQWSADCSSLRSLGEPLAGEYVTPGAVAFSPDGGCIAAGSWDGIVRIWDAQTSTLKFTLTGHTDSVNAVSFSSQGTHLASASQDTTVRIWDARTGSPVGLAGHNGGVRSVAFCPDGTMIASRSNDGTVRVWNRVAPV